VSFRDFLSLAAGAALNQYGSAHCSYSTERFVFTWRDWADAPNPN
jgi:hypothetical protein